MREIDIKLVFGTGKNIAAEVIKLQVSSRSAGQLPEIVRDVYAPRYFETGYEGHSQVWRALKNEGEVMFFVDLTRELFEKRKLQQTTK